MSLFLSQLLTFTVRILKVLLAKGNVTRKRDRKQEVEREMRGRRAERRQREMKTICQFILQKMIILILLAYLAMIRNDLRLQYLRKKSLPSFMLLSKKVSAGLRIPFTSITYKYHL